MCVIYNDLMGGLRAATVYGSNGKLSLFIGTTPVRCMDCSHIIHLGSRSGLGSSCDRLTLNIKLARNRVGTSSPEGMIKREIPPPPRTPSSDTLREE